MSTITAQCTTMPLDFLLNGKEVSHRNCLTNTILWITMSLCLNGGYQIVCLPFGDGLKMPGSFRGDMSFDTIVGEDLKTHIPCVPKLSKAYDP